MNILFIYPNINGFHDDNYHHGLASIVGATKAEGYKIKVLIITETSQFKEIFNTVKSFKPKVVGISSVSSQYHYAKEIFTSIKALSSDIITVCGGIHPTIYTEALKETEHIDAFFVGESEQSFVEFLGKVEKNVDYKDTDNLAYHAEGQLFKNKLKPLITNLDLLVPPEKELYPYREIIKKLDHAPFFFSRGCPFLCTYCSNHKIAGLYGKRTNTPRFRSPELCIQEIEFVLENYDVENKFISIGDDTFGQNKRWLKDFCEKYKKRINKKFLCLLRVELAKETTLKMLHEAGCFRIAFGVESGNDYIRTNVMNRKMSDEQIISAFDLCRKYGIETMAINIIGLPSETEEMIMDTVNLNRRIRATVSAVNIFYPYKGTVLGDKCFSEGLVDNEKYESFSNERRDTVLKYPKEMRDMLSYYHKNWVFIINPYSLRIRYVHYLKAPLKQFLVKLGIFNFTKRIISALPYR